MKIDQSFVRDLATDNDDLAIVRAIIAMARALRLSVIAEGVETAEQLALLRHEDCHEYQGYFFAHPVDADSIDGQLQPSRAASGCSPLPPPNRHGGAQLTSILLGRALSRTAMPICLLWLKMTIPSMAPRQNNA